MMTGIFFQTVPSPSSRFEDNDEEFQGKKRHEPEDRSCLDRMLGGRESV